MLWVPRQSYKDEDRSELAPPASCQCLLPTLRLPQITNEVQQEGGWGTLTSGRFLLRLPL